MHYDDYLHSIIWHLHYIRQSNYSTFHLHKCYAILHNRLKHPSISQPWAPWRPWNMYTEGDWAF